MLRGPATPRSRSHTSSSRFVQPPQAVVIVMTSELAMKEAAENMAVPLSKCVCRAVPFGLVFLMLATSFSKPNHKDLIILLGTQGF